VNATSLVDLLSQTSISLKAAFGASVIMLMSLSYMLGFSHADKPKEVVCALEIKQVEAQNQLIKSAQSKHHESLQEAQTNCMQREQDVCSERVENFRESFTKLRCKICKAKKRQ
jgi:hypothetical protein